MHFISLLQCCRKYHRYLEQCLVLFRIWEALQLRCCLSSTPLLFLASNYLLESFTRLHAIGVFFLVLGPGCCLFFLLLMMMMLLLRVQGCCGDYYSGESSTQTYYLNNFDNLPRAYVTLFELLVVNNWFVIMDGVVAVTSEWARIYFIGFYIIAVNICLNVVVAFILETFLSRMTFQRSTKTGDLGSALKEEVILQPKDVMKYTKKGKQRNALQSLSETNVRRCALCSCIIFTVELKVKLFLHVYSKHPQHTHTHIHLVTTPPLSPYIPCLCVCACVKWVKYTGSRPMTMTDINLQLFEDEVKEWCDDDLVLRSSMLHEHDQRHVSQPRGILSYKISHEYNTQHVTPVKVRAMVGNIENRLPWALSSFQTDYFDEHHSTPKQQKNAKPSATTTTTTSTTTTAPSATQDYSEQELHSIMRNRRPGNSISGDVGEFIFNEEHHGGTTASKTESEGSGWDIITAEDFENIHEAYEDEDGGVEPRCDGIPQHLLAKIASLSQLKRDQLEHFLQDIKQ
eukprot:m.211768 g.211768  ORF g.211768 m.211768 type:complete len:513 (+) comp13785_c3_seq63:1979-3517(+)